MQKRFSVEQVILAFIIIVGVVLRLFHLDQMPFMHDEFSALFRTRFNTFSDVIETGVKTGDTHPAGIQVFLWWLVGWVGENKLLLKLPFVVMGILAIPLTYHIGKEWFNKNVGLIAAVFIASSQYTLTYSVIIRPYISGLFFGLAMVYFWTALYKGKSTVINYLGYILFAALCAYNHHFSLLFAFVVGVTGLVVFDRKYLVKYLLAGVVIVGLYVPHFSVLFFQLNKGGLDGWLSAPSLLFPLNYLKYILHFSVWNYLAMLLVFFISLLYSWNKKLTIFYKISLSWFAIPLVVGMIYSLFVSPVIQYSMLLFTFPFLLFALVGLFPKDTSKRLVTFLVIGLLAINVFTLITERQHYRVLYQTRHLQFLKDLDGLPQKTEATIVIANHTQINKDYQEKLKWDFSYINYLVGVSDNIGFAQLQQIINESHQPYFIYGGVSYADPEIVQLIQEKYPFCSLKKDYYASNLYLFSKVAGNDTLAPYFTEENSFTEEKDSWRNVYLLYLANGAEFPKESEWGPTYSVELQPILRHRNDVIDISIQFQSADTGALFLVTELRYKDSLLNYAITPSSAFLRNMKGEQSIYKTIELSGVHSPSRDITFTTFLWNREKITSILQNYSIKIRRGNPIQYSLYEPILPDYE